MAQLEGKPDPIRRGTRQLSAKGLNQLRKIAPRQIRGCPPINVSYFGDRVMISYTPDDKPQLPGISNYLRQFVVLVEEEDYLVCTPFYQPDNGETLLPQIYNSGLGTDAIAKVLVAKPYWLQQTPWDEQTVFVNGVSVTYDYTAIGERDANGVSQSITPSYFPGDVILAAKNVTGYIENLDPDNQVSIVWEDVNAAARQWSGSTLSSPFVGAQFLVSSANSLIVPSSTFFLPKYDTINYNVGGFTLDPLNESVRVPAAGWYEADFTVNWPITSTTGSRDAYINILDFPSGSLIVAYESTLGSIYGALSIVTQSIRMPPHFIGGGPGRSLAIYTAVYQTSGINLSVPGFVEQGFDGEFGGIGCIFTVWKVG